VCVVSALVVYVLDALRAPMFIYSMAGMLVGLSCFAVGLYREWIK